MDTEKGKRKGLVIVHTGKGKGKTTSALGMAMRAAGHGMHALMIQFIKGKWRTGELRAAEKLAPYFELRPVGKGFVWKPDTFEEDVQAAREAWSEARQAVLSGEYDMVILDEINCVVDCKLLPMEEVLSLIREKPADMHLVLTGRNAYPQVIEAADLVTEMIEVKHPFQGGVKAQRGIEF